MHPRFTWTVGRRLAAGFSLLVLIAAAIGGSAYFYITKIAHSAAEMNDKAMPAIAYLTQAESMVKENYINCTQHLMSTDVAHKTEIEAAMDKKSKFLTEIYAKFEPLLETQAQLDSYATLKKFRVTYRDVRKQMIELSRAEKFEEAKAALNGPLQDAFIAYTDELRRTVDIHREEARLASDLIATNTREAVNALSIGIGLAVLSGILAGWLITRRTNGQLRNVTNHVSEGSAQL